MHFNLPKYEKQSKKYQPLVLIVDDDRDNLLYASCVVDSMQLNYAVVENSQLCLDLVNRLVPDVILLDIVMPKLDGLEIARVVRQNQKTSHISIIAVTGLTEAEYRTQINDVGCDDYLCKPYFIEELESKIYSNLDCALI